MIEHIKNLRAWLRWAAGVLTILASTTRGVPGAPGQQTPAVAVAVAVVLVSRFEAVSNPYPRCAQTVLNRSVTVLNRPA